MKALALAALLLSSIAAHAAPAEDAYLALRDHDIAALAKVEDAKDTAARDSQYDDAVKDLEQKLKSMIGPVRVTGFPAGGKLNLSSLFAHDEGFGMLDGLVYGEHESGKNLVVTTAGLLDRWLLARRADDPSLPAAPTEAVKTELFYTWAVSTDSAVVHYTTIPVPVPADAKVAYATLSARTQDGSPGAPDQIFVVLERGGRVYIANEKLTTPMKRIAACNAVMADYTKKADAVDKAYVNGGLKDATLPDEANALRNQGDIAFRGCVGEKLKGTPAFKAAVDQAAAIVAALKG